MDVTLLAAVAALASLRLPPVKLNKEGTIVPADVAEENGDTAMGTTAAESAVPRYASMSVVWYKD